MMRKRFSLLAIITLLSCQHKELNDSFSDFEQIKVLKHPDHAYHYWVENKNPNITYIDNKGDGVFDTIIISKTSQELGNTVIYQDQNNDGYLDYKGSGSQNARKHENIHIRCPRYTP